MLSAVGVWKLQDANFGGSALRTISWSRCCNSVTQSMYFWRPCIAHNQVRTVTFPLILVPRLSFLFLFVHTKNSNVCIVAFHCCRRCCSRRVAFMALNSYTPSPRCFSILVTRVTSGVSANVVVALCVNFSMLNL